MKHSVVKYSCHACGKIFQKKRERREERKRNQQKASLRSQDGGFTPQLDNTSQICEDSKSWFLFSNASSVKRRTCATRLTDCLGVSRQVSEKPIHSLLIAQLTGRLPRLSAQCASNFQGRFCKRSDFSRPLPVFIHFVFVFGDSLKLPADSQMIPTRPGKVIGAHDWWPEPSSIIRQVLLVLSLLPSARLNANTEGEEIQTQIHVMSQTDYDTILKTPNPNIPYGWDAIQSNSQG